MIRKYIYGDERGMSLNNFSKQESFGNVFFERGYKKYSLDDNGKIKCIMLWKEFLPNKYATFLIMSDNIEMRHIRAIKGFFNDMATILNPSVIVTYSLNCPVIDRWHKFLGFKKDSDCQKVIDDKVLNRWVIKWA